MSQQEISESCDVVHFTFSCFPGPGLHHSMQHNRWVCSKAATVKQTVETGTAVQQQPPLPAAASTGGRSAAESRTSLSRLCCSLPPPTMPCSSPAQTLAWQQGNPSTPPGAHSTPGAVQQQTALLKTTLQQQTRADNSASAPKAA